MPQSVIASVVGVTVSGLIGTMLSAFSFNAPVSAARWAEVTISAVAGTGMNVFSFDAPVGSHGVLNFPHTGGASVTVSGLNFGRHDVSPSVAISALSCHSAAWTSGTSLLCRSALLWGYHGMAPITIGGLVATLSSTLSFDAPVVSHAKSNTPRTGGVEITVNGLNFALQDLSTSVRISLVACGSSVWISRTMIRCAVPRTTMPNKVVAVTVSRVVSTGVDVFTFDSPVLSRAVRNTPVTGGATLSVLGLHFGWGDFTPSATVSSAACMTSAWSTSTSLLCAASGESALTVVALTISSALVGTGLALFTHDAPILPLSFETAAVGGTAAFVAINTRTNILHVGFL